MKKLLFLTLLISIYSVSCRGPLQKPGTTAGKSPTQMDPKVMATTHMNEAKTGKQDIKTEPAAGGVTIAALFSDKKTYSGKTVKVRGKVTKVNPSIMGKNWIHLQDGTEFEGNFDLTVTSDFVPEIGSTITVEGKIALDKDFGYGYSYPVIMEEAKLAQ